MRPVPPSPRASRRGPATGRAGLTLPEIMIAMTILGLVMTAALTLFIPSLGRFAAADTTYDAERHAMLGLRMIAADLRESSFSALWQANGGGYGLGATPTSVAPPCAGLLIPTPRDADGAFRTSPDGAPNYQQGCHFYWTQPEDPPEKGFILFRGYVTSPQLASTTIPARRVAAGVSGVTVTLGSASTASATSGVRVFVEPTALAPATPGGRGRVVVRVATVRFLNDRPTMFEGEKTVDLPY